MAGHFSSQVWFSPPNKQIASRLCASRRTFRGGQASPLSTAERGALTHVAPRGRFPDRDGPRGARCGLGWALPPGEAAETTAWEQPDCGCGMLTRSGPRFQRLETRGGWETRGPPSGQSLPDTGAGLAAATHQPVLRTQRGRRASEVGAAVGDRAEGPCPDAPVGP